MVASKETWNKYVQGKGWLFWAHELGNICVALLLFLKLSNFPFYLWWMLTVLKILKNFQTLWTGLSQKVSFATFAFNPFLINPPFLYPLKTSKTSGFLMFFRGYRSGTLVENKLNMIQSSEHSTILTLIKRTCQKCCCQQKLVAF